MSATIAKAARSKADSFTSEASLQYLRGHDLPASLNVILEKIFTSQPPDPLVVMERELRELSRRRATSPASIVKPPPAASAAVGKSITERKAQCVTVKSPVGEGPAKRSIGEMKPSATRVAHKEVTTNELSPSHQVATPDAPGEQPPVPVPKFVDGEREAEPDHSTAVHQPEETLLPSSEEHRSPDEAPQTPVAEDSSHMITPAGGGMQEVVVAVQQAPPVPRRDEPEDNSPSALTEEILDNNAVRPASGDENREAVEAELAPPANTPHADHHQDMVADPTSVTAAHDAPAIPDG